jgi:hypothetical protein
MLNNYPTIDDIMVKMNIYIKRRSAFFMGYTLFQLGFVFSIIFYCVRAKKIH